MRCALQETAPIPEDADTSDLFTGVSRSLDKSLWVLEALLQTGSEQ